MGNVIKIYLTSEENGFNENWKKHKNSVKAKKGKQLHRMLQTKTGNDIRQTLSRRLKLFDYSRITLWLLDKDGNIVEEFYYSHGPKRKAVYRVVTDVQEIHKLRMKHGAWTDRMCRLSNKGNTYATRYSIL